MHVPCRSWLQDIAADYGACAGLTGEAANDAAQKAANEAEALLRLMPWHGRIAVGGVEIVASLFCWLDLAFHSGHSDHARTMRNFTKVPVISSPLFRLYRSVVAATFFELPVVLTALGIEDPQSRQERFRATRDKAA